MMSKFLAVLFALILLPAESEGRQPGPPWVPASGEQHDTMIALLVEATLAISEERYFDLAGMANAETLAMVDNERKYALQALPDILLEQPSATPCVPIGTTFRVLALRQAFDPVELAELPSRQLLALALQSTIRMLSRYNVLDQGQVSIGAWQHFPDRSPLLGAPFVLAGLSSRPQQVLALWGIGDFLTAGDAWMHANDFSIRLLARGYFINLYLSPLATLGEDGRWRLDFRWLLGNAAEAGLIDLMGRHAWSMYGAGDVDPDSAAVEQFLDFVGSLLPHPSTAVDRRRLLMPTEPLLADERRNCPSDYWPDNAF